MNKNFNLLPGYVTEKKKYKILFFHIPKCGGSSVCGILKNLIDKSFRANGNTSNEFGHISSYENFEQNKQRYLNASFVFGHFQFSIRKYFKNFVKMTSIRNPIDRSISHYNMLRNKKMIDGSVSIEDCFRKNLIPSNVITQIFSCASNRDLTLNEKKLKKAKELLQNDIHFIFNTNDTNFIINKLISELDLPNILYQNRQVSEMNFFDYNDRNLNVIKEHNLFDINVFNFLNEENLFYKFKKQTCRNKNLSFFSSTSILIENKNEFFFEFKDLKKIKNFLISKNFNINEV